MKNNRTNLNKQECAKLVVEAYVLAINISIKHGASTRVDSPTVKPHRVYKKSSQRFERRFNVFDAAIADSGETAAEIYVGQCSRNTPPQRLRTLTTDEWNVIHFDTFEFTEMKSLMQLMQKDFVAKTQAHT